jgi:DNA repair exonuclease SbcCD ATPase subunit
MDECRVKLREHVEKGDPLDVAAYCAFLWYHGQPANAPAPSTDPAEIGSKSVDQADAVLSEEKISEYKNLVAATRDFWRKTSVDAEEFDLTWPTTPWPVMERLLDSHEALRARCEKAEEHVLDLRAKVKSCRKVVDHFVCQEWREQAIEDAILRLGQERDELHERVSELENTVPAPPTDPTDDQMTACPNCGAGLLDTSFPELGFFRYGCSSQQITAPSAPVGFKQSRECIFRAHSQIIQGRFEAETRRTSELKSRQDSIAVALGLSREGHRDTYEPDKIVPEILKLRERAEELEELITIPFVNHDNPLCVTHFRRGGDCVVCENARLREALDRCETAKSADQPSPSMGKVCANLGCHDTPGWAEALSDGYMEMGARAAAAENERDELRGQLTEMHRRAQRAEAAAKTTIEDCEKQGVSLGRTLANEGYDAMKAENASLKARVEELENLPIITDIDPTFKDISEVVDALSLQAENARLREAMGSLTPQVAALVGLSVPDGLPPILKYHGELIRRDPVVKIALRIKELARAALAPANEEQGE